MRFEHFHLLRWRFETTTRFNEFISIYLNETRCSTLTGKKKKREFVLGIRKICPNIFHTPESPRLRRAVFEKRKRLVVRLVLDTRPIPKLYLYFFNKRFYSYWRGRI